MDWVSLVFIVERVRCRRFQGADMECNGEIKRRQSARQGRARGHVVEPVVIGFVERMVRGAAVGFQLGKAGFGRLSNARLIAALWWLCRLHDFPAGNKKPAKWRALVFTG
ncbi:hypothetical protein [Pseudomonas sp. RA_15y_Pfl2_54]|uniref:hypothetical protein n=1 Tax=Pseudomonas sp. RA_15y_Pfl2_54 TaxID=3088704 RepID=UPI0030DCF503